MFRQQNIINCHCSLFSPPQLTAMQCRSPPPFNENRKENRSKKSLKYHSNSRNKDINRASIAKQQIDLITSIKLQTNPHSHNSPIASCISSQVTIKSSSGIKKGMGCDSRFPNQNIHFAQKEKAAAFNHNLKVKHKNAFEMLKQNYQSHSTLVKHHIPVRTNSPLHQLDHNQQNNSKRQVNFNYQRNEYGLRPATVKFSQVSPPPCDKMFYKHSQVSNTTTLAGSIVPSSLNDTRYKNQQENIVWSRQSMNQATNLNPTIYIQNCQEEIRFRRPSEYVEHNNANAAWISRPRTSSNIFALSRLDQIMNEKEETQSIYQEGEKPAYDDQNVIEFSRVLISCKKLMEEKNGILEESAQTKLFDFEEEKRGVIISKFQKNSLHQHFQAITKI